MCIPFIVGGALLNAPPVWFLFVVDTIITIFATITAWNGLAVGWGDPATLAPLDWPFGGLPFLSGLGTSRLCLPAFHVLTFTPATSTSRIGRTPVLLLANMEIAEVYDPAHSHCPCMSFAHLWRHFLNSTQISITAWVTASFCGIRVRTLIH